MVHIGIHVFVNNRKVRLKNSRITGYELLRQSGFSEAEHWNLYRLQGENDLSGGRLVGCDEVLEVRDGDWFRVTEGHQSCR